jgi:hypothetical protein
VDTDDELERIGTAGVVRDTGDGRLRALNEGTDGPEPPDGAS